MKEGIPLPILLQSNKHQTTHEPMMTYKIIYGDVR